MFAEGVKKVVTPFREDHGPLHTIEGVENCQGLLQFWN